MFKKILVPLDGSENAERVIPWVKRYAKPAKALVILLRVVPEPEPGNEAVAGREADEAADYLMRFERELNYAGIPAKLSVVWGAAPYRIAQAAKDEKCGLVIMTTRGKSRVGRWKVGGVTAQVMRLSPVPVLVVRSRTLMNRQGRVRRILVPLDGSALAEAIVPWAERLARLHRARLVLLHVFPDTDEVSAADEQRHEALRRRTGKTCGDLRKRGVRATLRIEWGDAASRIVALASPSDLITMTTHGYGGYKRWILGSVAEKVIQVADAPVFIFKGALPAAKKRTLEGAMA